MACLGPGLDTFFPSPTPVCRDNITLLSSSEEVEHPNGTSKAVLASEPDA
jgi:hypothetical protein